MRRLGAALAAMILLPASDASGSPTATGTIETTAERAGWVAVQLDRPVTIFGDDGSSFPDVKFSSGGDLRLVALRADLPDASGQRPMIALQDLGDGAVFGEFTTDVLPAGSYRLHVISEKPAAATLTLPGVPGTSRLTPERDVTLVTATPGTGPSALPSTTIGFASFDVPTPLQGVFHYRLDAGTPRRQETCFVFDAPDTASSYDQGCPGGFSDAMLPTGNIASSASEEFLAGFSASRGDVGFGANVTTSGDAKITVTGVGYTFDDPQLALATPAPTPPAAAPAPWVSLPAARAVVRRGRVRVPLACAATSACVGTLRAAGHRVRFRVPAGDLSTVSIRVTRRAKRLTVDASGRDATGSGRSVRRTLRLVRSR